MANIELKYQILLKMTVNMELDPKNLEGDRTRNEAAIFELENEGFVKIIRGEFSPNGSILICFLTDRGFAKQQKILETIQKSKAKIQGQWFIIALRFMAKYVIEIIIGVTITVLGARLINLL